MISRDYAPGDEEMMNLAPNQWHLPFLPALAEMGGAVTIWGDSGPLIIIGITPVWDGVAEGWSVVDVDGQVPIKRVIKATVWWMDNWCRHTGIRRLEATAASQQQFKWMRVLGFEPEYVKPEGAPDGTDVIGMVKWYRRLH